MKAKKKRRIGIIVVVVIACLAVTGALTVNWLGKETTAMGYEFTQVVRGDIENVVSSSGTMEPVGSVNVLAQMNGTVESIYADYNDSILKDAPLLDLNTDILEIQVKEAQASVLKSQAGYDLALLEYNNDQVLAEKNLISEYDLKTSETNLDIARADLVSAEANLEELQIELNHYALILSPITGIVLERNVDVGDTVMSGSSSATTLFTLAEDLSAMEIYAEVDELDISMIAEGMPVRFTVDAYPEDTFDGTVQEVRLLPETESNVVSYTVIVDTENEEDKLLPGMTASLEFIVEQKEDVLLVPNASFRYEPTAEEAPDVQEKLFEARIADLPAEQQEQARAQFQEMQQAMKEAEDQGPNTLTSVSMGRPGGGPGGGSNGGSTADAGNDEKETLWYVDAEGELAVQYVQTGATDGSNTELIEADDLEGTEVILRVKVD